KCGVQVETRRACFEPNGGALIQAEEFLRRNGLLKGAFVTASHGNGEGRHWPNSNLTNLAAQLKMPMVVFGRKMRSEEHTSELQSRGHLVCRLLLEKKTRPIDSSPQRA